MRRMKKVELFMVILLALRSAHFSFPFHQPPWGGDTEGGHRIGDPPDGERKDESRDRKSHPKFLKCVLKCTGVALQVDLIE